MQVEYCLPAETVRPVAFAGQPPGIGMELGAPGKYRWRPALGYASASRPATIQKH